MTKYTIKSYQTDNEIILAFLSESCFNSFELIPDGIFAYLNKEEDIPTATKQLDEIAAKFDISYHSEKIPYKNWNEVWESNFEPVIVDDFCVIRADFHDPIEGCEYEITINPKMAFGTGHHETSFMMLQLMRKISFFNTNVLDYGAGTGILSIIASYKGSKHIDAIDIEKESYLNTKENANINKVDNIKSHHGILSHLKPFKQYDVILANINRKVLLDSAEELVAYCKQPTILLLSGILRADIDLVQKKYQNAGFQFEEMVFKGEWVAMKFHIGKPNDEINIIGKSII